MKISELKQTLKAIAQNNKKIPVLIEGEMGIGKSQVVQQVAEEIGYQYVDLRLAHQEPGDLIGLPRIVDGKTYWTKPEWIPEKNQKLMLALEELNRAPIDVQQAIFQVLTEYKIHTHELPDVTMIVICINPSDGIYHVSQLDPAMITRCVKLKLEADADEWIEYAYKVKIDDRIIRFISVHRDLLSKPGEDASPNPRTWKLLSDIIGIVPENVLFEIASGLVGKEAAVAFQKFCDKEYKKPISGKEILNDYAKVKSKILAQRNDEMSVTVKDLIAICKAESKLTKIQLDNLVKFLKDTSAEWKIEIIQNLPEKVISDLSKTEIVDEITSIIEQIHKAKTK